MEQCLHLNYFILNRYECESVIVNCLMNGVLLGYIYTYTLLTEWRQKAVPCENRWLHSSANLLGLYSD
jgi:hypothetical protein